MTERIYSGIKHKMEDKIAANKFQSDKQKNCAEVFVGFCVSCMEEIYSQKALFLAILVAFPVFFRHFSLA